MKKFRVLVGVTRLEELEVEAEDFEQVEFQKSAVPNYDSDNETIEILNIEEIEPDNTLDLNNFSGQELLGMKFAVLQDINGTDTCWNMPKAKLLKKGNTVIFTGSANNGDIFVKDEYNNSYIVSRTDACETRYPYDRGIINLDYFRRI